MKLILFLKLTIILAYQTIYVYNSRMQNIKEAQERIISALVTGLGDTYKLHESLGESGVEDFQQNPYGERALAMDVQAEKSVISALEELNISFEFFSEEHGRFTLGKKPKFVVSLDGLDGSAEYKDKRGVTMYGTMASVLRGANPTYDDYLACGIMIHSPLPELFLAVKDQGCFSVDLETGKRRLLRRRDEDDFSDDILIDLDTNWPPYKQVLDNCQPIFPNMQCTYFSQAARTALFARGEIDIQLDWTRKGNLEQPTTYGIVRELGGVMVTTDGISLGRRRFKTFGQDTHTPLIVAPSQGLAEQVIQKLNLTNL